MHAQLMLPRSTDSMMYIYIYIKIDTKLMIIRRFRVYIYRPKVGTKNFSVESCIILSTDLIFVKFNSFGLFSQRIELEQVGNNNK